MSWFQIAIALLKITSYIVNRISITEGMRKQLADELIELEGRIQNTKIIVSEVSNQNEEEIDAELKK